MINVLYLHAGAEMYGADKVMLDLVNGLDKDVFNIFVVLPCNGPLVNELKRRNISVEVIEYPILRRKYFNLKGIFRYFSSYFRASIKLNKIAKKNRIDIVHVNTLAVLEGLWLKIFGKRKLVWHVHEIITSPKFLNTILCKLTLTFSDKIVTVSEATKLNICTNSKSNNKIKVIYNGVNNRIYNSENDFSYIKEELHIPENVKIIGMIGRVNSWKGQVDFIKAINPILKEHKNVYAVLVGGIFEGEEYRMVQLKELVDNLENKNRIVISDFRNDPQNIHNMFDIFVLPSTNPDPLPTVVLEAMASKKPIIGYRHGGVCEMVKEGYNGLLANVKDIHDLSLKIKYLLENEDIQNEMGEHSLVRQLEMFSLDAYINNFTNLYKEVFNDSI